MGTDIHPVVFIHKFLGEEWTLVAYPPSDRSYGFFWWLAEVRYGSDEPVPYSHPRGLPEDMQIDLTGAVGGDHSPGWYSLAEFRKLPRPEEISTLAYYKRWLKLMKTIAKVYELDDDRVRVLFQFDS